MNSSVQSQAVPRAFISYSWDDAKHRGWVTKLATRLRNDGIDVTLDRWHAVPGDQLPSFMESAVRLTDFVLVVCTLKYKTKSDKRSGGVGYEGDIMTAEVMTSNNHRKFIPILRGGTWEESAPSWMLGKYYVDLRHDPYSEDSYIDLLTTLQGKREGAPPLSNQPTSATTVVGVATSVETSMIELRIDRPFNSYTDEEQRRLLDAIAKLLEVSEVTIRGRRPGSVKLLLQLTSEQAERLYWAVQSGRFAEYSVTDATILSHHVSTDSVPLLARKPIGLRVSNDYATKMRLKYTPSYHAFEAQRGAIVQLDGKDLIMLCSDDYLGLSIHPKVIEAGRAAMLRWGTSTTGARSSNGTRRFHAELEEKLAAFLNREACHVSVSGYLSSLSSVAAFAQKGDVVLADKNVRSSLWDGIRLSMATVERFSHNNPDDLSEVLATVNQDAGKMLVIEGVYSMDGHIARLPELADIAEKHGCFTVVDDANGVGILGREGRGTVDHFSLNNKVDVICGSMSKSLASTGGFVAASHEVIEYLRTHSKQTIFSAAISPSQAACALASLELMQSEPQHLERLWSNTRKYRAILKSLGLDIWESETPAISIVLGSKERVYTFWKALLEKGVFTVMSIAPAVPAGKDLIRTAISATHTDEHLERISVAMAYALKRL